MPRESGTITVREIPGEPCRYLVESFSKRDQPHMVDLLKNDGNGACSCTWFQTTCQPNFRKNGGKIIPYGTKQSTLCRHLQAARFKFTNDVLRRMSQPNHE